MDKSLSTDMGFNPAVTSVKESMDLCNFKRMYSTGTGKVVPVLFYN
jgi:hypothetical protein